MRKKKKKPVFFVIFAICIILCGAGVYVYSQYQYRQTPAYQLLTIGYSKEQVKMLQKNLNEKELKKVQSLPMNEKILDLIQHKDFKFDRLNRYLDYQGPTSIDELILFVNKDIDQLEVPYDKNITLFLDAKYTLSDHLERYLDYQKKNTKLTIDEIITNVNSNLDYDFYTHVQPTDVSKKNLVIVNKYHHLEKDYVPSDLTSIDDAGHQVTKETATHFKEMVAAAKKEHGYTFKVNSAYRSYNTQNSLYTRYKSQHGFAWAEQYSARPGYSEHQTGLAIDMVSSSSSFETFEDTKEYQWLIKNAHKYGFILRYQKGKEYITGYNYEPWHYRYVGIEDATKIYEAGLTYEEYYAFYVK